MFLKDRRKLILGDVQPAFLRGAEMGPLNNPIVKKSDGDIIYIDYAAKHDLQAQHEHSETINSEDIVEVDFVWAQQPIANCLDGKDPLDYVVAAHVIEHTPDLIGWLHDIALILKPGGLLGLAIPDRRHTFDYLRNESTIGEMVEAYLLNYKIPSIRQVFDHCFLGVNLDRTISWKVKPATTELTKFMGNSALPLAFHQAKELTTKPRYIDSHCWVFTPGGWLHNMSILASLELMPFRVEEIVPTVIGELEFIMRLRRCSSSDPEVLHSIERAQEVVRHNEHEIFYKSIQSTSQSY